MLSPKTQTNLKNAKGYFEEHLSVGDYYSENERVRGEWAGEPPRRQGVLRACVPRLEWRPACRMCVAKPAVNGNLCSIAVAPAFAADVEPSCPSPRSKRRAAAKLAAV